MNRQDPNSNQCIYCKSSFVAANREHVLQNFLGARWDSPHIVCNHCQSEFSGTIDPAFEEGVRPIRAMLGTRGGRGGLGRPLKDVVTTAGERVDINPGGVPKLTRPSFHIGEAVDGSRAVRVTLRDVRQWPWALAELREKFPGGEIDEEAARQSMRPVESHLEGAVETRIEMGGTMFFRGLVEAGFNLLAAHSREGREAALSPAFDAVRAFVLRGEGDLSRFVRWSSDVDIPKPYSIGALDHALGLVTRERSVEGVAQIFGHISIPFRLSNSYEGRPMSCGYVVDPFREADPAESRLSSFPSESVPEFSGQHTEIGVTQFTDMRSQAAASLRGIGDLLHPNACSNRFIPRTSVH